MKTRLALLATLLIAAAGAPAGAHHQSTHKDAGHLAFWNGVIPGAEVADRTHSPDYWKKAFVSKYSVVGFDLPSTLP